ncbi:CBF-domain-containing protein [Hymenopellis radicata]|nr:CBF-domain-containing protein [Hymenopellis radicata]
MARIRQGKEKKLGAQKKRDVKAPAVATEDAALVHDVSSFIKKLKSGGGDDDQDGSDPKSSKYAKSAPKAKPQSQKSKQTPKSATNTSESSKATRKQDKKSKKTRIPRNRQNHSQLQNNLRIATASQWYTFDLAPIPSSTLASPAELNQITTRAASLHARDIEAFQVSSSAHTSEAGFLSKIIQSGTLSDRLSALTLLVQSGPIHNIKALETLKTMAERGKGKGGREESLKALRCIVDWWVGGGAPSRKLKYFRDRPLRHADVTDQHLLLWYFEDWLKKYFFSVLQILETLSLDPLTYVRTQAMNLIFILLRDKPEQEQNLLRLLALCSRASHHLLQLLQTHPSMKSVIVTEIVSFHPAEVASRRIRFDDAPKPKPQEEKKFGNPHVRYYATITFNQIVLTPGDREVAVKLIDLYFEIFKELLGEGSDSTSRDDKEDGEAEEVAKDHKGRVMDGRRKKGKGKWKGKDKASEVRGAAGFTEVEDEHSKLISAILTGVNRALPFAKIDVGDTRLSKHIDTLFLITHKSTFNISLQALVLIQQISSSLASSSRPSSSTSVSKSIVDRFYRTLYDSLHDARLASSSKQAMYLNLLFKSIKADVGTGNGDRVKALVRRFVQLLVSGGSGASEFVAGGLFLLGELFSTTPGLREMITRPASPDDEPYDPRKRDPQYSHASSSPLWELTPLLYHYHPTISLLASQLLSSQPLSASADLSQNTLSHFLDRFVYKNAKKTHAARGVSAMQPAAGGLDGTGVKLIKGEESKARVNDAAFAKRNEADVRVDELFFHRFFSRKNERHAKKGGDVEDSGEEAGDGSDEDEEEMDLTGDEAQQSKDEDASSDDEEEDEIWKAMKATMPNTGDNDDALDDSDIDDDDDIPSGLDDDSEDGLSLAEGSGDDDLVPMDGLIEFDGSDSEDDGGEQEEEWGGIAGGGGAKRKRAEDDEKDKTKRKKAKKSLPTFASYEDYAKMIEDGPEDDI